MPTTWSEFRERLNLTQEEEEAIRVEREKIEAIIEVREQNQLPNK